MIRKNSKIYRILASTYWYGEEIPAELSRCEFIFRFCFCWLFWGLNILGIMMGIGAIVCVVCIAAMEAFDRRRGALSRSIESAMRRFWQRFLTRCPLGMVKIEQ